MKEQRPVIICPGIYKHFKHTEDGGFNNYMYAVMGVSKPLEVEKFPEDIWKYDSMQVEHTEKDKIFIVYVFKDCMYHVKENCVDELVIYKSLYDSNMPYARPIDMFSSEVEKDKYPFF